MWGEQRWCGEKDVIWTILKCLSDSSEHDVQDVWRSVENHHWPPVCLAEGRWDFYGMKVPDLENLETPVSVTPPSRSQYMLTKEHENIHCVFNNRDTWPTSYGSWNGGWAKIMLKGTKQTSGLLEIKEVCLYGGPAFIPFYIYAARWIGLICAGWTSTNKQLVAAIKWELLQDFASKPGKQVSGWPNISCNDPQSATPVNYCLLLLHSENHTQNKWDPCNCQKCPLFWMAKAGKLPKLRKTGKAQEIG